MTIYTPYTYFIAWTHLNKWYYGVRFAKKKNCLYESGCHPNDLFVTYFTSSKIVKEFINNHGNPDIIKIDKTFKNSKDARDYEHSVLTFLDVKHNQNWLNQSLGKCPENFGPKNEETKRKISEKQKGVKRGKPSEEHRENLSKALKGRKVTRTKEHQEKLNATRKCQKSEEHKRHISESMVGKKKPRITCPHCEAITTPVALSRFHSMNGCPSRQ